jgi:hypothetical protein
VNDLLKSAGVALAAILATAALTAAGCQSSATQRGEPDVKPSPGDVVEFKYKLEDGRTVTCVAFARANVNGGGLACDWGSTR